MEWGEWRITSDWRGIEDHVRLKVNRRTTGRETSADLKVILGLQKQSREAERHLVGRTPK